VVVEDSRLDQVVLVEDVVDKVVVDHLLSLLAYHHDDMVVDLDNFLDLVVHMDILLDKEVDSVVDKDNVHVDSHLFVVVDTVVEEFLVVVGVFVVVVVVLVEVDLPFVVFEDFAVEELDLQVLEMLVVLVVVVVEQEVDPYNYQVLENLAVGLDLVVH
jgi:hypothetical protein